MFHIASALRTELQLSTKSGDFLENGERFLQVRAAAGRHVEYASRGVLSRSPAGQQVGADGIVDVGEVAALLAVSEDGRRLAAQHLGDKFRQHARVRRRGILPRAKDIEVAK